MKKDILLVIILAIIIFVLIGILLWPDNKPDNSDLRNLSINPDQEIESPLMVEGEARGTWFFEASFPIKILDENGNVLSSSYVQAQSDWMTEDFVAFKGQIGFISETTSKGFLVLQKDNPSGLPEYDKELRIPVILKPSELTTIKLYFINSKMDPGISCDKVFYVERDIPKIEAIGSATLWQLLSGPTEDEKTSGFSTSINSGVKLQSLSIDENGTATADFDNQLEYQVGGSCRVIAIRSQITETLKQFETIKDVVISINGRTEDILQP
ncbi:MAG: GerMN domain-containing protein [Patescibacteria group bacterium]